MPDGSIDVIICDLSDPLDGGPCYQLYTTSFYAMQEQARARGHSRHAERLRERARLPSRLHPHSSHPEAGVPAGVGAHFLRALFTSEWGFNIAHKEADGVNIYTGLTADGSLEKRLAERGLADLSYYDSITHTRMFSLNRTVREKCEKEDRP